MNEPPYVLNETQLELLLNATYYLMICTYKTPLTPSEAARHLEIPANVAHYRTKRLFRAGLLKVTDEGRKGCYSSVARSFLIPAELIAALHESSLLMLEGMLSRLQRALLVRTEQNFRELGDSEPLTFDLSGNLNLSNTQERRYPGSCYFSATNLSSAQYREITEAVKTILDNAREEEGEKTCTLAFIAFDAPFMR